MSLTLALNTALTGLNVSQQSLAVLSQNIANANTPGYSRQVATQQALSLGGRGAGVQIEEVVRRVDEYLNNAMRNQSASLGQTSLTNDYSTRIQLLLGQPGSNNSIDSYVNTFFNNMRSLAQTPDDTTLQRTAVNSGVSLANQIQNLATALRDLQFQADQDIASSVTDINQKLTEIHQLNVNIVNARSLGRGTADLEDQRDVLIRGVSEYVSISTFERDTGAINIVTTTGISLLDDNQYQLTYTPAVSPETFSNGSSISALAVNRLNENGDFDGNSIDLVTGGSASNVTSFVSLGKLEALVRMRDQDVPDIIEGLDMMASTLRDQVNTIHNMGSGFPGANGFTGSRLVGASDFSLWSGEVRIAVLGQDGQPLTSPYPDETGFMPLTIDMEKLVGAGGVGYPSTQDIINEINQYYGVQQRKVEVGNLNNIRLVSDVASLPGNPPQFTFDFDLNNISGSSAKFYVTDVDMLDDTSTSLGTETSTIPSVALDAASTFTTTNGSQTVTITTTGGANGLSDGQVVYLRDPGMVINGIPAVDLTGYFTITNVTATSFDIVVTNAATATGAVGVAGLEALPPYTTAPVGSNTRAYENGLLSFDLSANPSSAYYTINVSVGVDDGTGVVKTSVISYRINNSESNLRNMRLSAIAASGQATLVQPTSSQPLMRAIMVDADGNELPKIGTAYTTLENGYLKLVAGNSTSVVAVDSLDSQQEGRPNDVPPLAGSNRGFSYYFELNNFFKSNESTATGDTIANSAIRFAVEDHIRTNPGLLSLGSLVRVPQSSDPDATPLYTYQRNAGDNTVLRQISDLGTSSVFFAQAGSLSQTTRSFSAYAAQIVGSASTNAATAKNDALNAESLMNGYTQRASAVSGVNLDTELANTVIYQNSYAASARVISVANELFDTLLQTFR
jgi:flagellar hook-associated protein FlgK